MERPHTHQTPHTGRQKQIQKVTDLLILGRRHYTLAGTLNGNFDDLLKVEFGLLWEWESPGEYALKRCPHTFISFLFRNLTMFSQWVSKTNPLVGLAGDRGKVILVMEEETFKNTNDDHNPRLQVTKRLKFNHNHINASPPYTWPPHQ